jgi:hypothetical protein
MPNTDKRENIKIVVVSIAVLIVIPIMFLSLPKKGDVIVYNCSIAEISPDFPIQVKEECRRLRAENNLQKPK